MFEVGIYCSCNKLHNNNNKTKYESLFYNLPLSLKAVDKVAPWADSIHPTRSSENFSGKPYTEPYGDKNGEELNANYPVRRVNVPIPISEFVLLYIYIYIKYCDVLCKRRRRSDW